MTNSNPIHMKLLTTFLLSISCILASAQQKPADSTHRRVKRNGYFNLTFQAGFKRDNNSLGAAVNFGARPSQLLGAGVGFELLKFKNLLTNYVPAYADFRFYLFKKAPVETFILVQPGYGFYNHKEDFSEPSLPGEPDNPITSSIQQKGGFYFGSGLGVRLKGSFTPVITARYAHYNLATEVRGEHFAAQGSGGINSLVLNIGISF